jgi:hypothetical protein
MQTSLQGKSLELACHDAPARRHAPARPEAPLPGSMIVVLMPIRDLLQPGTATF